MQNAMRRGNAILPRTTQKLLSNNAYDIEFNGYLSNHAKHAIVALSGLHASEDRIHEYWKNYTSLTPYNLQLHRVDQEWNSVRSVSSSEWRKIRGEKVRWQEQVAFMDEQLRTTHHGDSKALIRAYAPEMLDGIAGALTHGIIHLGLAIDASNDWMICEGLAYLNFSHLGVDSTKFTKSHPDDNSLFDALVRISDVYMKDCLAEIWVATSKASHDKTFHPELVPSGFQWELSKVLYDAHPVATEVPTFLYNSDADAEKLFESLYKDVVVLYLATVDKDGHGSFLILHALTSLWGLEQTLNVIHDWEVTLRGLRQYYASLICLLATSGGYPKSNALKHTRSTYMRKVDDRDFDWANIVQAGIAETEEHNIKLVYVCRELWKRHECWSGYSQAARTFTVTPNIGPQQSSFAASM